MARRRKPSSRRRWGASGRGGGTHAGALESVGPHRLADRLVAGPGLACSRIDEAPATRVQEADGLLCLQCLEGAGRQVDGTSAGDDLGGFGEAWVMARVTLNRLPFQSISSHSRATSSDVRSPVQNANCITGRPSGGSASRIAACSSAANGSMASSSFGSSWRR